jgi:hypothetical protein
MPKLPNVTDAEIIACHVAQDAAINEMHDFSDRIQKGYIDKIEHPVEAARAFAIIAEAASRMTKQLLLIDEMQKRRAELEELKRVHIRPDRNG